MPVAARTLLGQFLRLRRQRGELFAVFALNQARRYDADGQPEQGYKVLLTFAVGNAQVSAGDVVRVMKVIRARQEVTS